ncbi:MAG: twin transmembrane helix small protein [Proteobacteria bacterium]|nr:twin transmembrane helix small protein [Pseudomonadota bacterium]
MEFKYLIVLMLVLVLISLGKALYHLSQHTGDNKAVVRSLSWRIGLSAALFLLLILAYTQGWIRPNH